MSKLELIFLIIMFWLIGLKMGWDAYEGEYQQESEQVCMQLPVEHGSAYIVLPKEEICNNYCK